MTGTLNPPEVDFPDTLRGHGFLVCGEKRVPVPSFTLARPKYAYSTPWALSAVVAREDTETAHDLLSVNLAAPLRLEGFTDDGAPLSTGELHLPGFVGPEPKVDPKAQAGLRPLSTVRHTPR
jgi:hypothetical protein